MDTRAALLTIPRAISVLGDPLSVRTLVRLAQDDARFGELESDLSVRPKVLSARLKRLQEEGMVTRVAYPEIPPRVVYGLTEKGRELVSIMHGIGEWDDAWRCKRD